MIIKIVNKKVFLIVSVAFISLLNGRLFASELYFIQAQTHSHDNHTHQDEMSSEEAHHEHKMIAIPENVPIPKVELIVHKDAIEGWNLEIKTTNFYFAPATVNKDSVYNNGHAHLYINGKKVTRIYSNWFYLQKLPSGENEIKVTLNTNKHEDLMYQGKMISDVQIIKVSP